MRTSIGIAIGNLNFIHSSEPEKDAHLFVVSPSESGYAERHELDGDDLGILLDWLLKMGWMDNWLDDNLVQLKSKIEADSNNAFRDAMPKRSAGG